MLESIVIFSKGMNLKIIAEFVDNIDIVHILNQLSIDYAQPESKPLKYDTIKI